jgi:1-deoxy-D-xylulose-5-phosphate reductoisomerase
MAAADEVAVGRFLEGKIGFLDIPAIIEKVLEKHQSIADPDLDTVLAADAAARIEAHSVPVGSTA